MELIDKSAVVAEIERLKKCNRKICGGDFDFLKKAYPKHYYSTEIYNDILSFLDTLEVEEVDMPALDNENMPIKRWKEVCKAASCQANYRKSKGLTETCDDYFVDGVQWADEHPINAKEVDLDEEIERFVKSDEFQKASGTIKVTNLLARHFFELGLNAKGE